MARFLFLFVFFAALPVVATLKSGYGYSSNGELHMLSFCHEEYHSYALPKKDKSFYTRFLYCSRQGHLKDGRPKMTHLVSLSFLGNEIIRMKDDKLFVKNPESGLGVFQKLPFPKSTPYDEGMILTEYIWEVPEVFIKQFSKGVKAEFHFNVYGEPFGLAPEEKDLEEIFLISSLEVLSPKTNLH